MDKQLFIKIEEHEEIKGVLEEVKNKISATKSKIELLKSLKDKETTLINNWGNDTTDIEKKVQEIEKILDSAQ
jgi:SMC interacting uncharacterized protein involved in chromosome segregation